MSDGALKALKALENCNGHQLNESPFQQHTYFLEQLCICKEILRVSVNRQIVNALPENAVMSLNPKCDRVSFSWLEKVQEKQPLC